MDAKSTRDQNAGYRPPEMLIKSFVAIGNAVQSRLGLVNNAAGEYKESHSCNGISSLYKPGMITYICCCTAVLPVTEPHM